MKFTKLMALALVLVMLVSAFVACGGGNTETTPDTTTKPVESDPKETEKDPADETIDCVHPKWREVEVVDPTCTEDGYKLSRCTRCQAEQKEPIPAAHIEASLTSVDGNYIKYTCVVCGQARVTDKNGAAVADASAIKFPFFVADFTFEDKAEMADVVAGYGDIALGDVKYVFVTNNKAAGNGYANVPSGSSDEVPNGYFVIKDVNNKLATGDFSVKLDVQFTEMPLADIALLTWNVGGSAYELVTVNEKGEISVLGASGAVALEDKGWDTIEVKVDVDSGSVFVDLNGKRVATGKIGAAVSGKTDSSVKFFEAASQFEANIDNISIGLIDEAK